MIEKVEPNTQDSLTCRYQKYIKNFCELVRQIQKKSHWKVIIMESCKIFNVKIYNLQRLTPTKVKRMYQTIVKKFYFVEKIKNAWHENELRIFIWTLINLSNLKNKHLENFEYSDWEEISSYFSNKTPDLCKFQYNTFKKLSRFNTDHEKWTAQQDQLLYSIIMNRNQQEKNKWNQVAKQIFSITNFTHFKSPKQCRERWYNYLDPTKIKGSWTVEEDVQLIKFVIQKGKKWSSIAKILENKRTQHMVKNRFKSLISREQKIQSKKIEKMSEQLLLKQIQRKLMNTKYNLQYNSEIKHEFMENNKQQQNLKIKQQYQEIQYNNLKHQQIKTFDNILPKVQHNQINYKTLQLNQPNLIPMIDAQYQYHYWLSCLVNPQQILQQNGLIYPTTISYNQQNQFQLDNNEIKKEETQNIKIENL